IEIRVPEGFEGPRFVPPTSFAGRLVPFARAGVRHTGLSRAVREQTDVTIPEDAWLLIDGGSPRASRWAVALLLLFVGFAAWNIASVARVLSRVRAREGNGGREDDTVANSRIPSLLPTLRAPTMPKVTFVN